MTVMMVDGLREVVEVEGTQGQTDEDLLGAVVERWLHALTCDQEIHLIRFRSYPGGEWMVLAPTSILGFSLRVVVLQ